MVEIYRSAYGLFIKRKNQLEQVQICSQLEIILTFSRKCFFYRIFTLLNFTLQVVTIGYAFLRLLLALFLDLQGPIRPTPRLPGNQ